MSDVRFHYGIVLPKYVINFPINFKNPSKSKFRTSSCVCDSKFRCPYFNFVIYLYLSFSFIDHIWILFIAVVGVLFSVNYPPCSDDSFVARLFFTMMLSFDILVILEILFFLRFPLLGASFKVSSFTLLSALTIASTLPFLSKC